MKKPKRQKKPRRSARSKETTGSRGPFLSQDPFQHLNPSDRQALASALTEGSRRRFQELMQELLEVAETISPLHILAMLSYYALMAPPDVAARAGNGARPGTSVQQGHVEFFQAMLLRHEFKRVGPPDPELSGRVFEGLPGLFDAHGIMQISSDAPLSNDENQGNESAARMVQAYLRNHTTSVRNWGYFSAVQRISTELFSVLDTDFQRAYGLTLSQLIALFTHLVRRQELQLSENHLQRLQKVDAADTIPGMGKVFADEFSEYPDTERVQEMFAQPGLNKAEARYIAFMAAESVLPTLFIFDAETIAEELQFEPEAVGRLLDRLSLSFGDLREQPPERLLLNNPVWQRPLIKLDQGLFFCALPQTLMSFVLSIVDDLIEPFPAMQIKLQKTRAKYLEDQADLLMRKAFDGCEVFRGYKWIEGDRQYESDLAVRYDSTIFLVESKSGRVTWPALRGSPDRIIRHVQDLIVDPSDQSGRLSLRLQERLSGAANSPVEDFPLSLDGVHSIVRLSLMLQDFATIQSVPSLLADAGLINSEYQLAPCLTLSDLEVVIDLLETPYLRLHYLRRRAELAPTMAQLGDELDTIGFYLDTGLNLGEAETGKQRLVMPGYSTKVDRYYVSKEEGIKATKPKANLTPWIRSLCEQLATRHRPGWSEMAFHLLSFTIQEQRQIEAALRDRQRKIAAGKMPKDGHNAMVWIPPVHRRVAVVFYIRLPSKETTQEYAERFANVAFDTEHVELCLVMGFRGDGIDLSYRNSSLLFRTDRSVQMNTYL